MLWSVAKSSQNKKKKVRLDKTKKTKQYVIIQKTVP